MWLNPFESLPALLYGVILFMCAVSYHILQYQIIKVSGKDSKIAKSIGRDIKGKSSMVAYASAIVLAVYIPIESYLIYLGIALLWVVPDTMPERIQD